VIIIIFLNLFRKCLTISLKRLKQLKLLHLKGSLITRLAIDPPKVPLMDENFLRGEDSKKKSRSSSSATTSTSSSAAPFGGIGSPRQLTKTPGSSSSATTSTSSS
jgi:hypothetical protein